MINSFLDSSFEIPWSKLTPEVVKPEIGEALDEAQSRLDALADTDKSDLTFENTLLALESAVENLNIAWGKVGHLDAVCNSPKLRKAHNDMLPRVSEFTAAIALNEKLWEVIKAYADTEEAKNLSGVRRRYLKETLADFRDAGADLPSDKKKRFEALQKELAQLTQKYSENLLDSTNAFELVVDNEGRLAGLPSMAREAARIDALEKGHGSQERPKWRLTLHAPSFLPAMKYLDDEGMRRQLWEAFQAVGRAELYDNTGLIWKILALREEKARLLGKDNFADWALDRRMAKCGHAALKFVEDLHHRIKDAFDCECSDLAAFKSKSTGKAEETIEPWEAAYWSEKMRRQNYAYDEEELRPYFPIDQTIAGMFKIAERIFAIRIVERTTVFLGPEQKTKDQGPKTEKAAIEVWHPKVKYYEVWDGPDRHLGSFYADWHPRESKRGGAWMNYLRTGGPTAEGRREPHLGLICGNLTAPLPGKPALLTHDEVCTIFHEFGHLLHHILGEVEIKSLNGVNVAWDFVELPSQIMENWCWERISLDLFARHYETDAIIPDELFEKMIKARNFQIARVTMRQLSLGKMDLELHMHYLSYAGRELDDLLREMLAAYTPKSKTPFRPLIRRFGHLFADSTGYAAGYYSYKWAEVLEADAFTRFKKEGILHPQTGREFREKILSKGNSADPAALFRDFMGRDPDLHALLERSGLITRANAP